MDHAQLIYGLMMKMDMDLGSMISSQITYSNSLKLGVPTLITAFYDIKGVS